METAFPYALFLIACIVLAASFCSLLRECTAFVGHCVIYASDRTNTKLPVARIAGPTVTITLSFTAIMGYIFIL